MEQHEVIHIAEVVSALELVLDELIQLVEIDIGEELTGEIADGQRPTPEPNCLKARFRNVRARGSAKANTVDQPRERSYGHAAPN
jgi:hypothetical protein